MRALSTSFLLLLAPVAASALTINGNITHPTCSYANGSIDAYATGGAAPYSYMWSPVPPSGQGVPSISGLTAGTWTLTVTDNVGTQASHDFVLVAGQLNVDFNYTWVYDNSAAHHPCPGSQNGSISIITAALNGLGPYTGTLDVNGSISGPLGFDINTGAPYFGYFGVNDQVYLTITDFNGCSGSSWIGIDSPQSLGAIATNINPSCGGLANGSAELIFGFAGPYGPAISVFQIGVGGAIFQDLNPMEPLVLTGLEAGDYTVYGDYSSVYFGPPGCGYTSNFTIPDLGPDCGSVSGRLYIDNNQNCVQNGAEPSVPYRVIEILPGPQYAITNANGDFTRNLINGNFTLEAQGTGTDLYPICPSTALAPFTVNYNNVTVNLADSSLVPLDVQVTAHANVARPGFAHTIWGNVRNLSAQISGAVTLTMTFDAQMSYASATPAPTTVNANTITWDLPALSAFGQHNFSITLQVPADVGLIGQPFAHAFTASQSLTESTLANNMANPGGVIQGAYDPNDKRAFTSSGWSSDLYYIGQDEWIDYVIRFQNTGTDTSFTVVVSDTLAADLDMASFEQGVASHPFTVEFKNDRVVEWRFANILLPDSGTNEAASHGLISFRIKPAQPLVPGSVIANNADIFFDFNPPIRTNDAVLTTEFSTAVREQGPGQVLLVPNPASDHITLTSNTTTILGVRVFSADGRLMRIEGGNANRCTMEVSDLSPGIYVAQVRLGNGGVIQQRFIKH
ncbi:MAG: T9SS type A sorting domain-containing protein [Flavobacteriales bacterium]|nr:T9SS type A sorting domain-containing protein [Flavobacteriales bacterium]MCC6936701.1 T9SS type A sorting domain-containing protein [Flavobacteriales bacterium]